MKIKLNSLTGALVVLLCCILLSCEKGYLDKIPDKSLLVPSTIADFQALLDDNNNVMNLSPFMGEISSDNYFTTDAGYLAWRTNQERDAFTWSTDPNATGFVTDWDNAYRQVFYSNIVLDGLNYVKGPATETEIKHLRGSALFYRAYAFYNLAQIFAAPYDPATAGTSPGIPIRLTADVNLRPGRGTVAETYERILSDVKEASVLLPESVSFKSRPSQAAALALLARINLNMENYTEALSYSTKCLQTHNTLIDYNTLNPVVARPFPLILPNGNDEVIYYSRMPALSFFSSALTYIDPELFKSYSPDDLRRSLFFLNRAGGNVGFRGSYSGRPELFSGLATDEMILIRAECLARQGDLSGALEDLNSLLIKRWKTGTFMPETASTAEVALATIITERRKELLIRGLRWGDLRRLNGDSRFTKVLSRTINSKIFTLPPGDKRYVLLIPQEEIAVTGIAQNPR